MAKKQRKDLPEFEVTEEGLVVHRLFPRTKRVSLFTATRPHGGDIEWYLSLNGGNGTPVVVERKDDGFIISHSQIPPGLKKRLLEMKEELLKKGGGSLLPLLGATGIYRIQV